MLKNGDDFLFLDDEYVSPLVVEEGKKNKIYIFFPPFKIRPQQLKINNIVKVEFPPHGGSGQSPFP